jgi:hypothetical protein
MSDFLSNLAARSLGTSELIRPRVPYLFEPYRPDGDVPATRASFRSQETTPEPQDETGLMSDGEPPHTDHQITKARPPAPIRPLPNVESAALAAEVQRTARPSREGDFKFQAPTIESTPLSVSPPPAHEPSVRAVRTGPEGNGSVPPRSTERAAPEGVKSANDSELESKSPVVGPQRSAEPTRNLSSHKLRPGKLTAPAVERTGTTKMPAAPLPSMPNEASSAANPVAGSNSSSASVPISPLVAHESVIRAVKARPDGTGPVINPPIETGKIKPENSDHRKASELVNQTAVPHGRRSTELEPVLSRPRLPAGERVTPAVELREVSVVHSVTSVTEAVRPPVPRSEAAKIPATAPDAKQADPAIQVTIGRVEVRAIFPEAPARRAQTARPRPTVSLDDYLKRSNRGQR